MSQELTKAAQAALNACERIIDQEGCVHFGINFHALASSLRKAIAAQAQQPAGDVVMDAERWRYAFNCENFAVCKWEMLIGENRWVPISETSGIDAALASSARKGE